MTFIINIKQLVYGLFFFLVTTLVGIGISIKLDYNMNNETSNIIGLFASYFLDFFIQQKIFMKNIKITKKFLSLYISTSVIAIFISHSLFVHIKQYIKKNNNKKWNKYVNIIRINISIFVYIFYHYPIYKWLVFKK